MKIFDAVKYGIQQLQTSRIEFSDEEVRLLLAHAIGQKKSYIHINGQLQVPEAKFNQFKSFIEQRKTQCPTSYIIGEVGFYKYDFIVNKKVLIPRPETEQLVQLAVDELKKVRRAKFIDIGCGSGCIGLSIASEVKDSRVLLVDISEEAILVAQENAAKLGVCDRVEFICSDILDIEESSFKEIGFSSVDLVVSNPPYIALESKEVEGSDRGFEPHIALFGGANGWELYKPWAEVAQERLNTNSLFICEIGFDQKQILEKIFAKNELWGEIKVLKDLSGRDRILLAKKKGKLHG